MRQTPKDVVVFDKPAPLPHTRSIMPLITFEGSEGCGKSTQVKRLIAHLQASGISAAIFREPGGTAIGEAIRHLLQHAEDNRAMKSETELLLFEASRSQLVREKIRPALARGEVVVCDRFFDSTTVYQGAARSLDPVFVKTLNDFAIARCIPDVTFVLDIDRETSRGRLTGRKQRDRMEEEPEEFHTQVIAAYRELVQKEPHRCVLVDARATADAVEQEIWDVVITRFPRLVSRREEEIA